MKQRFTFSGARHCLAVTMLLALWYPSHCEGGPEAKEGDRSSIETGHSPGALQWAIPYGKEFWRRGGQPGGSKARQAPSSSGMVSADIDLGDIIDRVSHAIVTKGSSSVAQVQARTYAASFDEKGLRFSPNAPVEFPWWLIGSTVMPDPGTEVSIHTHLVSCGKELTYRQGAKGAEWLRFGNTAQRLLDDGMGLVEHYEAGAEGVQVSWVLRAQSAREGPLEIELAWEGLNYAGTSARGIHLADDSGTARVCIGRAQAVDAAGHRFPLPAVLSEGSVRVTVAREILARASYPLAIDPLISPEFGMDIPVIVPEAGFHAFPAVAWNGTNWLVVWAEWLPTGDSPEDVVAARVSSEGSLLDPTGIMVSRGNSSPASPAVASNGSDFLVVWHDSGYTTGDDIYGARVMAGGQVGRKFAVDASPHATIGPSVAGSSGGYVVVWQGNSGTGAADIYGTRVSNEGLVLDPQGVAICTATGIQAGPAISSGPGGFLVVWSDGREDAARGSDIFGARLDESGAVLDTNGIAICTVSGDQGWASVAGGSSGYLVAWADSRSTTNVEDCDIYATLISPAGLVSHPQGIAVSTVSGNQTRPSVAASPAGFLVVWDDQRTNEGAIYASRVSLEGVVLDPEGVVIDPGSDAHHPHVAADGTGFLVVWDGVQPAWGMYNSSILAARLSGDGEVVDPKPILLTAAGNAESFPAIASNGAGWLAVWQDNRNLDSGSDIYGVRINYDGTVLDATAIPISTQSTYKFSPAVASGSGDYLVVWKDGRNFSASFDDIYGARVNADGKVLDPGGIPICTAPDFQATPAVTSDGTNYLVVWQDARSGANEIYATRVDKAGVVLEPGGFPVSAGDAAQIRPGAAFNGEDFLVAWLVQSHGSNGDSNNIYGARIDTHGVVLDPSGIAISLGGNAQLTAAVACSRGDSLVVWKDTRLTQSGSIYGARIGPGGGVLDPDGFLISAAVYHPVEAVGLAFNGSGFLAAWDDRLGGVAAASLDPGGGVLLSNLTVNTDGGYPVVAAGPSNSFLVISYTVRGSAARTVGNRVFFFDPPIIRSLTLTSGLARLSWSAEPGKTYRVQFRPDLWSGNWNDLGPLVIASNILTTATDPSIGLDARRYYRVIRLP